MTDEKLSGTARSRALHELEGWSEAKGGDAITRTFQLKQFN